MENKQTAVMWLQEQFHKVPFSQFGNLFQQAKTMERDQIEEAYKDGFEENVRPRHDDASDYFTKKYGNERFADMKFSELVSMYRQQMRDAKTNDDRRKQINNFRSGKF